MKMSRMLSNDTGAAMLFVLVLAVICGIMMASISFTSRYTIKKSGDRRGNVALFNIVEAGKEDGIAKIRSRAFNPVAGTRTTINSVNNFGGGSYTVSCSAFVSFDTVSIISRGTLGTKTKAVEVIAYVGPDAWKKWIRGAVTARTDVSTLGKIEIDGEEYDTMNLYGNLLNIGGTVGVSAGGAVSIGSADSKIGGHFTAPQNTTVSGETVEQYADTNGYPTTPEEVLGLPAGALNSLRMTGCPSEVFEGLTYITQDCNNLKNGRGILICHNESGTASLENYHAHFKGLIIADEVKHFNGICGVVGAVFLLGKKPGGNCLGNGRAQIHYSSQAIAKALQSLPGLAPRNVTVLSWRELR